MKIFAIGDLHLPGWPREADGHLRGRWTDHGERIAQAWRERVGADDIVLLPGDISWAMTLEEAADDLAYLGALPGEVIIRGNHDYWWSAIGKVRQGVSPRGAALQNDCSRWQGKLAVCGTRGWTFAGGPRVLVLTKKKCTGEKWSACAFRWRRRVKAGLKPAIAMMHYPPAPRTASAHRVHRASGSLRRQLCVYGHLHGEAQNGALSGTVPRRPLPAGGLRRNRLCSSAGG